jgi:hypothetical protein
MAGSQPAPKEQQAGFLQHWFSVLDQYEAEHPTPSSSGAAPVASAARSSGGSGQLTSGQLRARDHLQSLLRVFNPKVRHERALRATAACMHAETSSMHARRSKAVLCPSSSVGGWSTSTCTCSGQRTAPGSSECYAPRWASMVRRSRRGRRLRPRPRLLPLDSLTTSRIVRSHSRASLVVIEWHIARSRGDQQGSRPVAGSTPQEPICLFAYPLNAITTIRVSPSSRVLTDQQQQQRSSGGGPVPRCRGAGRQYEAAVPRAPAPDQPAGGGHRLLGTSKRNLLFFLPSNQLLAGSSWQ